MTKKKISLCKIQNEDQWLEAKDRYRMYFEILKLIDFNKTRDFGKWVKVMATAKNQGMIKRLMIPRIKREKKKPIKGNLVVKTEGDTTFIQVSHFKKRKILKIDTEDVDMLLNLTKNSFYFIARRYANNTICYVLSKKKYRTNSLYSYLFKKKILTTVIHLDGDKTNYRKSNLKVTDSVFKEKDEVNPTKVFKKNEKTMGVYFRRNRYYARQYYNKKIMEIYAKDKEEAMKIYDISRMYYYGINHSFHNQPDYYFSFEQELVLKCYERFKKRTIQPTKEVGTAFDNMIDRLYRQKETEDEH